MASHKTGVALARAHKTNEKRGDERRDCALTGKVSALSGESPITVVNLSPRGIAIVVNAAAKLAIAENVAVSIEQFGKLTTNVRWAAHPRYGLEFGDRRSVPKAFVEYYEALSPERLLAERMGFIDLDNVGCDRIASFKEIVARELPIGLDKFYARVRQYPGLRNFFSDEDHLSRAKSAQVRHWEAIGAARFDGQYFANVRHIGEAHARIGLEPRWYVGGYALILEHLIETIVAERWPKSILRRGSKDEGAELGASLASLVKAVLLDMDISISVYLDAAAAARLQGDAETICNERTFVAESVGEGLSELAQKNLTYRMVKDLPDVYRQLQRDFNTAMQDIESALISVSKTAASVHSGMEEIATASNDLSRRTEQQAAGLEETSAALTEITGQVRKTAEGVKQAEKVAHSTLATAANSSTVISRTVTAMENIAASSREITQIIGVIDEIAFQTNLLALNAGVEAARASEHGRGFAVVAAEVRALAQRAAEAAKEIKGLIARSSKHVDDGVVSVAETSKSLGLIAEQVCAINGIVSEIAAGAQQQAIGLSEVNTAISQMDMITQQNAAMAEEATAASRSILTESEDLSALISTFQLNQDSGTAIRAELRKVAPHVFRAVR